MPLAMYQELSKIWGLGQFACNMWVSFDVTCCTASILNLCTISIDRYFTITRPLTYGVNATSRRSISYVVAIWLASCLISVPPLLVFGNEHGSDERPACQVSQSITYQLYATLGAFYIPLIIMIFLYYKIYAAAKKVVEAELKAQPSAASKKLFSRTMTDKKEFLLMQRTHSQDGMPGEASAASASANDNALVLVSASVDQLDYQHDQQQFVGETGVRTPVNGSIQSRNKTAIASSVTTFPTENTSVTEKLLVNKKNRCEQDMRRSSSTVSDCRTDSRFRSSADLRERKASVTLGVIMTAFCVCWLPFFILALLRPFSQSVYSIPDWIVSLALWLGYANSTLNPIIYVTFHQDFRQAFRYLLCCQCSTMGTRLRQEAFRNQYGCPSNSRPSHRLSNADQPLHIQSALTHASTPAAPLSASADSQRFTPTDQDQVS
jgi:5-hydroxytryptamine receptor 7